MAYADYSYYVINYGGTKISEAEFLRLSELASAYISRALHGHPAKVDVTDNMRTCMCAVADVLAQAEVGGEVLSASNDGYSETYAASGKSTYGRIRELIELYLWDCGRLCRWV